MSIEPPIEAICVVCDERAAVKPVCESCLMESARAFVSAHLPVEYQPEVARLTAECAALQQQVQTIEAELRLMKETR
jgi:hypothetical protein